MRTLNCCLSVVCLLSLVHALFFLRFELSKNIEVVGMQVIAACIGLYHELRRFKPLSGRSVGCFKVEMGPDLFFSALSKRDHVLSGICFKSDHELMKRNLDDDAEGEETVIPASVRVTLPLVHHVILSYELVGGELAKYLLMTQTVCYRSDKLVTLSHRAGFRLSVLQSICMFHGQFKFAVKQEIQVGDSLRLVKQFEVAFAVYSGATIEDI
jgi:hypothetical protein